MALARKFALGMCALAFAGSTMGADSCAEATDDLNEATEDLEDITGDNDAKYKQGMKLVSLGMSKDQVKSLLGPPRDKQRFQSAYGTDESWYYGTWQLNFVDGELESKNRY